MSERPQSVKEELHNNNHSLLVETTSSNLGDLFTVTEKSDQDSINITTETKIEQSKQVKQIIYIYDDNTFEIYHLNK